MSDEKPKAKKSTKIMVISIAVVFALGVAVSGLSMLSGSDTQQDSFQQTTTQSPF